MSDKSDNGGDKLNGVANILDAGVVKIAFLLVIVYVVINGVPDIDFSATILEYTKFLLLGGLGGALFIVPAAKWVRFQLVEDNRARLIELDESGERMGKVNIDLGEYDIEIEEGSVGRRDPEQGNHDILLVRDITGADHEEQWVTVDGIIDWDDYDCPAPDQLIANKEQLKDYQQTTEKAAAEGHAIRQGLNGLKRRLKRDVVQNVVVQYERSTDSGVDIDSLLDDTLQEYDSLDGTDTLEVDEVVSEDSESADLAKEGGGDE